VNHKTDTPTIQSSWIGLLYSLRTSLSGLGLLNKQRSRDVRMKDDPNDAAYEHSQYEPVFFVHRRFLSILSRSKAF